MENRNNKYNINDKVIYIGWIAEIKEFRTYKNSNLVEYEIEYNNNKIWVEEQDLTKYVDILPFNLKKWIYDVIKPIREKISKIWYSKYNQCLYIDLKGDPLHSFQLPIFNDEDAKKMIPLNTYTLEDLGL